MVWEQGSVLTIQAHDDRTSQYMAHTEEVEDRYARYSRFLRLGAPRRVLTSNEGDAGFFGIPVVDTRQVMDNRQIPICVCEQPTGGHHPTRTKPR